MAARCQFLANVPLLQPLSHQQISKIAEAMSVEEFSAGDYVRPRPAGAFPPPFPSGGGIRAYTASTISPLLPGPHRSSAKASGATSFS